MTDLVNFKENLRDSITNSLLDYINYMHETKHSEVNSDALAKCVLMTGELFANKIKKGEITQDGIDSFEANLMGESTLSSQNKDLNLANTMVKEGNAMAFAEYESTFGENDNIKGYKKVA